ncbi:hypothetical protein Dsin_008490 [Dipteronia sinensis]|uniref:Uncharacterized protein n=1 Tax=Dipteronia sinensis TaxID=43782 RepID=A0AAE0APG4_9ROSI|nr:hypothetical protein Dsin_008490 [Dipteronia sinensis]
MSDHGEPSAAPTVKFFKEHLEKSGCAIGDNFFKAVHCDKRISGGYVRGGGVSFALIDIFV